MMDELCVIDFSEDLAYWMIDDIYLEACCEGKYTGRKEHVIEEVKKNKKGKQESQNEEVFGTGVMGQCQKRLWDLMEKPNSSIFAKVNICFLSLHNFQ